MEVRLRTDFYGTLVPKVSSQSILITVGFNYKGPAQTLSIETNTGKKGLWGDYDQESPAYYDSKAVSASDALQNYTFSRYIPLSFWGDRQIDDGAVEVVISGQGVYADAIIWQAYTVNIGLKVTFNIVATGWGLVFPDAQKWCCYYWDPGKGDFVGNGKWYTVGYYIAFNDVQSGGYVAVFFLDSYNSVSQQYTGPIFNPVNGGSYWYDVSTGKVS